MTRIAVITDIHANLPALQATLDAIARDLDDCGCAYVTAHDRGLGKQSVAWRLAHTYGGVLFVNCGSVGKPKDGDPRAAFAILKLADAGQVQVSIERVPYDVEAVARAVEAAGLPGEYARKLVAAA